MISQNDEIDEKVELESYLENDEIDENDELYTVVGDFDDDEIDENDEIDVLHFIHWISKQNVSVI